MAYKIETQKIIPGGLNLLAPGDQVAEGDCLELQDWWPAGVGKLEQSPGSSLVSGIPPIPTANSLLSADGQIYYGGGGSLTQIGGSWIDSGYDPSYPLGMISDQGYAWIINATRQRKHKKGDAAPSNWLPATPAGAPTLTDGGLDGSTLTPPASNPPEVGGLLAQGYSYYFTWQLDGLGETNPSPVGTIQPMLDLSIVRVAYPGTPPPEAVAWNIYRQSPSFGVAYRLNENPLDLTRTYVDDYGNDTHTHSDDQLLRLGIIMESDHDAPPPARIMANQIYNGRIVVANSAARPNRVWFTDPLQPAFFRGAANNAGGNWVDIGTDAGDEILFMAVRPNSIIFYRKRSIWRLVGDFQTDTSRIEIVVPDIGVASPRAVAVTSQGDYFVGPDLNVYKFNGDWTQKLSQKIERVLRGLDAENYLAAGPPLVRQCALGHKNGRLWYSYPIANGSQFTFVYHIETQRWFSYAYGLFAFLDTGDQFLGANFGVSALESGYVGGNTAPTFQSAYFDCGLPDHEKTWADLVISHNTQGATLTVSVRINKLGASSEIVLGTITSNTQTKQIIPIVYPGGGSSPGGGTTGGSGGGGGGTGVGPQPQPGDPIRSFSLSVRIAGSGAAAPITIDSPMLLHYYLEARRAKSFDTDETNHGTASYKEVDQVEFDIDATDGPGTLQVLSDTPGGSMGPRLGAGQPIAQTSDRATRRIVLTQPVAGKLLRYTATTDFDFQIYAVRARVLPIGVYLDGTIGDFWQPQPIGLAAPTYMPNAAV